MICEINGNAVLAGVTSWGIGCARAGSPGEWAKVSNYLDWIENNLPELETTPEQTPVTHTFKPSTPFTPKPTPVTHTFKPSTPKPTPVTHTSSPPKPTTPSLPPYIHTRTPKPTSDKPTPGENSLKSLSQTFLSTVKRSEAHKTCIYAALAEN